MTRSPAVKALIPETRSERKTYRCVFDVFTHYIKAHKDQPAWRKLKVRKDCSYVEMHKEC